MELGHPILCLFGHSADAAFPLVLVIGREPNGPYPVTNYVGNYDFRDAPRCAFWNTAYGVAARLLGTHTSALKQRAVLQNGSPIVFADALPHSIPTRVGAKHLQRAALPATDVVRHVDNLFSHEAVIGRVRLVIASGLQAGVFTAALRAIERNCAELGLPLAETAFFYGTNVPKIMDQLSEAQKQLIRSVFA
jgi:hypothetical protein